MDASSNVVVIEPPKRWPRPRIGNLWRNRELIAFFVWRTIKLRYRQTYLGIAWTILQPFITMVAFTIIFGQIAGLPSNGIPYPVFVLAALMPWIYFSNAVTTTTMSVALNQQLVTKIYFPRIVLPVSTVLSPLLDLVISLVLLALMMAIYRITPSWSLLLLPILLLVLILTAFSVAVWLAALNVRFRDVTFIVPFLIQLWTFLTPVVYPGDLVPAGPWRVLYSLNPMVGIIETFRWAIVGGPYPETFIAPSLVVIVLLFITGGYYFLKTEQTFADVI